MLPNRAILIPVDLAEPAGEALHYACDLARRYDATVTLLYVYQPPVYVYPFPPAGGVVLPEPGLDASQRASCEAGLSALKAEVEVAGAPASTSRWRRGSPTRRSTARRSGASMISW
jgi:nucleotide-binding universal stress UspA family protein